MAASPQAKPGRIFISYRRGETAYPAGWLYDRLADHYGDDQVFKDVDSIELGDDFVEVITRAVGSCDVLLALIGEDWLSITDAQGRRRLDDPHDFVRLEIEAALARNVLVIPILVGGAKMPNVEELPDSLARLAYRQALELSPARFDFDTGRLLKVLDKTLAEIRAEQAEPDATPGVPQATAATPPPAPQPRPRRSTRTWLLAGTGIAVVLILLIVVLANRGVTSSPTGAASPSASAGAATTSEPASSATTSPPANEPVLFRDTFSSRAAGWEGDGALAEGAGYIGGAYRISAPPALEGSGAGSVPMKASRVWPSAPPHIRIAVEGRRLPESDQGMTYGILCHINGAAAYVLTISDDYASIEKWGKYKLLKDARPRVDPDSTNELLAVCTGGTGQEAVHLELWVNGEKVVETTDTNKPLPSGGVGLAVTTYQTTRASVAEFDNFVVEQVA
jgi:TIR domain